MFTIQYKVFTDLQNPNSKSGIRKPLAKNHQKQPKKIHSRALPPNPQWGLVGLHAPQLRGLVPIGPPSFGGQPQNPR